MPANVISIFYGKGPMHSVSQWKMAYAVVLMVSWANTLAGQDVDTKLQKKLNRVTELVNEAGDAYKSKDFKASAKNIKSAQRLMAAIAKSSGEAAVEAMEKDLNRLSKARNLLQQQGQKFDSLPNLNELAKEAAAGSASKTEANVELVSFKNQVAPIIVEHCGQCHVQRAQGKYSAANYNDLKKGTRKGMAVKPNDIAKSRLITLVENNFMPPQGKGKSVPPEKLQILKNWVQQGAKFDGSNKEKKLNLTEFVSSGSGTKGSAAKGSSTKSSGSMSRGR